MGQEVFILGGSQTDFQRNWAKEGKSILALMREVVEDTLKSTGISLQEITRIAHLNRMGVFVGNFDAEQFVNQAHLGAFATEIDRAFYGVPSARYEAACASGGIAIDSAVSKLRVGDIDLALVIGIEVMKSVDSLTGGAYLGTAAYYEKESKGIEYPFPKLFGKLADELLKKYNLNETRFMDNLAEIAHINYENAKRNPLAQTRTWFMNKKHASCRYTPLNSAIGGKLAITDCSQITDGAAAVFLCSDKYLLEQKRQQNPDATPRILGWGCRTAPIRFEEKIRAAVDSPYILPWTRQAIVDALHVAQIAEDDIDFYETHDCFTSSEYAALSSFGLAKPGREYEAIENGTIGFDGKKPVNPSGGLIGVGHPVGASGVRMFLDLYKQVAGKAGGYQISRANRGMMLNFGGTATTNVVYVVGVDR